MDVIETQLEVLKVQVQAQLEKQAAEIARLNAVIQNLQSKMPFDLFPKLPSELRIRICSFALCRPRLITVGVNIQSYAPLDIDRGDQFKSLSFYPNREGNITFAFNKFHEIPESQEHPGLLQVCKESRKLALREQGVEFCLSTSLDPDAIVRTDLRLQGQGQELRGTRRVPIDTATSFGIRFRPALDIIYLKDFIPIHESMSTVYNLLRKAEPSELQANNIQHLAIGMDNFKRFAKILLYPTTNRLSFSGLKQLIVVSGNGDNARHNIFAIDENVRTHVNDRLNYLRVLMKSTVQVPIVNVMTEPSLVLYARGLELNEQLDGSLASLSSTS